MKTPRDETRGAFKNNARAIAASRTSWLLLGHLLLLAVAHSSHTGHGLSWCCRAYVHGHRAYALTSWTQTVKPFLAASYALFLRSSGQPCVHPYDHPSWQPCDHPSWQPCDHPSWRPYDHPSWRPCVRPSWQRACARPSWRPCVRRLCASATCWRTLPWPCV
jgi:hypothetical protein